MIGKTMAYSLDQMDPDVENIVIIHRNSDGVSRVAGEIDPGLNKKRVKATKVLVVQPGGGTAGTSGSGKKKSKKSSKYLRPIEKRARKSVVKTMNILEDYLYLHDRSNLKKKDGWLGSYSKNLRKAIRRNKS